MQESFWKAMSKRRRGGLRGNRSQAISLLMPNDYLKPLYDGFTSFKERCENKTPFKGSERSDVMPPLEYWRGDNPINEERLNVLFGRYLK